MSIVDKDVIQTIVKEAFENKIAELTEAKKEAQMEEEEKEKEENEEDESDEDENEEDEEESETGLTESFDVEVTDNSRKTKSMKVNSMRDIVKMAKTGQYEYFIVKKRSGEEIEFSVENGKLVEM